MGAAVFVAQRESHGQAARGTHLASEHAAYGVAGFLSGQPREHHCVGERAPGCHLNHARHIEHHYHAFLGGVEGSAHLGDEPVFDVGEQILCRMQTVGSLTTAAADGDDGDVVGLGAAGYDSRVDGEFGDGGVAQRVVGAGCDGIADDALVGLCHVGIGLDAHIGKSLEEIDGVGGLDIARAGADGDEVVRRDAKHTHAPGLLGEGQGLVMVLEQHDTFLGSLARLDGVGFEVGVLAIGSGGDALGAGYKLEHAAGTAVEGSH